MSQPWMMRALRWSWFMIAELMPATAFAACSSTGNPNVSVGGIISLGTLTGGNVAQNFVDAATLNIGAARVVTMTITGCDPAGSYRFYLPDFPITLAGSGTTVMVTPVVVGYDQVQVAPHPVNSSTNAITLTGNPVLRIVYAIQAADRARLNQPGVWTGSGMAHLE